MTDTPTSQPSLDTLQEAFRELVAKSQPLERERRELGLAQIQASFEINRIIVCEAFPNVPITEAPDTLKDSLLPQGYVASPHDIPRGQHGPDVKWAMATLVPIDDGRSAQVICQYLKDTGTEPSAIVIQRVMLRILLVR